MTVPEQRRRRKQVERRSGSYSRRVWIIDPLTGQRRQKRVTARTRAELERKEAELKARALSGLPLDVAREPFAQYLAHYLETADLAPATRRQYAIVIRTRIAPVLGAIPLGRLSGRHVQALYNQVRGTSYAQQVQAIVNGALTLAVREGVLPRNPAEGLVVGRREVERQRAAPRAWSAEELGRFLVAARRHWLFPLFWTLAHTGLRVSEACQLRWADVSLELGRLFVSQAKSRAGRRRVALDPGTVAVLRELHAEQERRRTLLGAAWEEHGLVFDSGAGRPVSVRTVQAVMRRLCLQAGLPAASPHVLRHTHATLLLRSGVPLHVVRERLGHRSGSVTLEFYAHALPADERDAAVRFAQLLERIVGDQNVTMEGVPQRRIAS